LRSIRVVINGEEPPQELLNEIEEKRTTKKLNLKIEYSEPGLTKARNYALATCSSDLITFIDDDVTVDADCFDKIEKRCCQKIQLSVNYLFNKNDYFFSFLLKI
jgi:predicted glycosyltransferase involved in capsule biosynthesis